MECIHIQYISKHQCLRRPRRTHKRDRGRRRMLLSLSTFPSSSHRWFRNRKALYGPCRLCTYNRTQRESEGEVWNRIRETNSNRRVTTTHHFFSWIFVWSVPVCAAISFLRSPTVSFGLHLTRTLTRRIQQHWLLDRWQPPYLCVQDDR